MALPTVTAVGAAAPSAAPTDKLRFADALHPRASGAPPSEVAPRPVLGAAPSGARAARGCTEAKVGGGQAARAPQAVQFVDRVAKAQAQLDSVLRQAERGKTFTPAELVALQAKVYRASQELDLAGKVVEKATGGVKQILQTQV